LPDVAKCDTLAVSDPGGDDTNNPRHYRADNYGFRINVSTTFREYPGDDMNETKQGLAANRTQKSILVIDDEEGMRDLLSHELGLQGYLITTAGDGEKAVEEMRRTKFDLVISDIRMPRRGGLETLAEVKRISPETEVIIMTGYGSIAAAVKAMKDGAYDFIQKPFNIDEMSALVEKALEKSVLRETLSMYEASKAVFSSVHLDQLLPIILRLLRETLRAEDTAVMLADNSGRPEIIASTGLEHEGRKQAHLEAAGKAATAPDIANGNAMVFESGDGSGNNAGAAVICKLEIEPGVTGFISANRAAGAGPFNPADLRGFTILAAQATQALRNARLYHKLEEKVIELETARNELIQSEKMAAVGRLTAGIAHELNNPLTGILGISELLLRDEKIQAGLREDIRDIHMQSRRCQHVIQDLMHFARKTDPIRETLDLRPLLEETLQLFKNDIFRAHITVRKLFPDGIPKVIGNSNQLKQVFVNILLNGIQSMEGKDSPELAVSLYSAKGLVGVKFSNNGGAIEEKDLPHIFEPFFTTRPTGKGMGLGLSVSYGIIKSHGGAIRAENGPGAGCSFTIELPEGTTPHERDLHTDS